jgi:hypothetical protein
MFNQLDYDISPLAIVKYEPAKLGIILCVKVWHYLTKMIGGFLQHLFDFT